MGRIIMLALAAGFFLYWYSVYDKNTSTAEVAIADSSAETPASPDQIAAGDNVSGHTNASAHSPGQSSNQTPVESGVDDDAQPAPAVAPYRAVGQEPGWQLEIAHQTLELQTHYGERRHRAPLPEPEIGDEGIRYTIEQGVEVPFTVQISAGPCADTMSGMPYPDTVRITIGEETLNGCGGNPAELLQKGEWHITSLRGVPVVEDSPATLQFDGAGGATGHGSCNRYNAQYTMTGEGLKIGPAASTRMACASELMEQEHRLFSILEAVSRFNITPDGSLELLSGDEVTLTAQLTQG